MKKLVAATLFTLSTVPATLFLAQATLAETYTTCYPVTTTEVVQNAADHSNAYANGYSEGRQTASKGKPYEPRSAGGEFGRGFDDGYWGRPFSGQEYAVPDRVREVVTQQCETTTTSWDDDDNYDNGWSREDVRHAINRIYREELGRDADSQGMRTYLDAYEDRGWSLERIRRDISNSSEARNRR